MEMKAHTYAGLLVEQLINGFCLFWFFLGIFIQT